MQTPWEERRLKFKNYEKLFKGKKDKFYNLNVLAWKTDRVKKNKIKIVNYSEFKIFSEMQIIIVDKDHKATDMFKIWAKFESITLYQKCLSKT